MCKPHLLEINLPLIIILCLFLSPLLGCEQPQPRAFENPSTINTEYDTSKVAYVVYYIGSSNCGVCDNKSVVKSINKIPSKFRKKVNISVKTVMIVMDRKIRRGIKFTLKYKPWDELSIGSFYRNELLLYRFNELTVPGVPHVLVFKDRYSTRDNGVPVLNSRKLVKNILGGKNIINWVSKGLPIDRT